MYILAKQRDTIARTLEPTKERDSRNVSGPLTDRRPSCRDLYSRTCGLRLVAGLLKLLLSLFAQPCRSLLNLRNFSTPTYRKKCILVTSEHPHLRLRSPGGRTVDEVKKGYGAFSKASTRRKKRDMSGQNPFRGRRATSLQSLRADSRFSVEIPPKLDFAALK